MARISMLVTVICIATACQAISPSVSYENRAWSVAIPDDLQLKPLVNNSSLIWASQQVAFFGKESTNRGINVDAQAQPCTAQEAQQVAQTMLSFLSSQGPAAAPELKHLGVNDVVIGSTPSGAERSAVVAVICGRERLVTITATGFAETDVERVLTTFILREPVSNNVNPPGSATP